MVNLSWRKEKFSKDKTLDKENLRAIQSKLDSDWWVGYGTIVLLFFFFLLNTNQLKGILKYPLFLWITFNFLLAATMYKKSEKRVTNYLNITSQNKAGTEEAWNR